jgi:hypothetical protein
VDKEGEADNVRTLSMQPDRLIWGHHTDFLTKGFIGRIIAAWHGW